MCGLACCQRVEQGRGHRHFNGGRGMEGGFEQQLAHALIAQRHAGVDAVHVNGDARRAIDPDGPAQRVEGVHLNDMQVLGGNEVQVRSAAVQNPGGLWS